MSDISVTKDVTINATPATVASAIDRMTDGGQPVLWDMVRRSGTLQSGNPFGYTSVTFRLPDDGSTSTTLRVDYRFGLIGSASPAERADIAARMQTSLDRMLELIAKGCEWSDLGIAI
jgi:hypothetical protein